MTTGVGASATPADERPLIECDRAGVWLLHDDELRKRIAGAEVMIDRRQRRVHDEAIAFRGTVDVRTTPLTLTERHIPGLTLGADFANQGVPFADEDL